MAVVELISEIASTIGTTGTILVFVITFLVAIYWLQKPTNLPPGPLGIPVFGYLPFIALRMYRSGLEPHELLTQMGHEHGKIYSFDLMGINIIVINDYKLLKEAMQNRSLNDRERNDFAKRVYGPGEIKMENYRPYRKFAISTFRSYGFGKASFEDMVSTEVIALIDQLKTKHTTDPRESFQAATTNVICAVVFGKRFDYTDERFNRLLHIVDKWNDHLGAGLLELFLPILKHIPTKAKQGLRECADIIIPFLEQIISEHRKEYQDDYLKDYIDAYLHQQKLQSGVDLEETSWLTDWNLRGNLYALFAAGGDTTSSILCWCLAYLTHNPKIQKDIHDELDTVIGRDRLPRLSDREKLPLTRAFILEILRITSIVPLGIAHVASESVVVGGYSVPNGSTIVPNIWAIHHDPEVWKDPEDFRPDRFLDDCREIHEREELITFDVGRRSCPGEALAKKMLYIFVTHLIHRFSFAIPQGSKLPSLKGYLGIVYKPQPFQVELTNRY